MGQLVGYYAFQFRFFQFGQYPGCKTHYRVLGVAARGKSIRRGVLYNIDFRCRQSGGNAKVFYQAVKLGVVLPVYGFGLGNSQSDGIGKVVGNKKMLLLKSQRQIQNITSPKRKENAQPSRVMMIRKLNINIKLSVYFYL